MKYYLIILIAISIIFVSECIAEDGKAYLDRGINAYSKDADFDKAISDLKKAIEFGMNDTADIVKAHLYLGFAYMAKSQRIDAIVEFAKAINLDPGLTLDPKVYSSKLVAVFNETKASLVDSLSVVSIPGDAEVFLDGKRVGLTPLKLSSVISGDHILTVSKEYYIPKTMDIKVYKGEENRIQIELEKAELGVNILSIPSEAIVYMPEKPISKTPISLKISLDKDINIKIAKEEFLDRELTLKLISGGISIQGTDKVFPIKDGKSDILIELIPAPTPGSLKITSEPKGALVYIDGVEKGQTPLFLPRVTPGNREIRVSIADFDVLTKKADVISKKETIIDFILGGTANLNSIPPGAQIFIDGIQAGSTPLKTDRLPIGSHQVKFSKDKYRDKNITVLIERGLEKDVSIRLLDQKGSLAVSSEPSGADVFINNELKGKTPFFIYGLSIGEYSIRLSKNDFVDWDGKANIKENELSWLFGKLIKQ